MTRGILPGFPALPEGSIMKRLLAAAALMCTMLSGCSVEQLEAHKAHYLDHMGEARMQRKITVRNEPWQPFIIVSQEHAYNDSVFFNSWLQAMVIKKDGAVSRTGGGSYRAGDVIYMLSADLAAASGIYSHIEYNGPNGPQYARIINGDQSVSCWDRTDMTSDGKFYDTGEQSCSYESQMMIPLRASVITYITQQTTPWEVRFVTDHPDRDGDRRDIVTASEARALVDRVNEVRAGLGSLHEATAQNYQP